ncbi:uncharacterized protein LOC133876233 [Alnus glutinosa]|uniref:uncharacterized protein LOC133876233 n=1 Tax=Alnus glutinosa TaxID=3517 RepID=UPI002D78FAC1|nr:uncharacterized protein LOC133876233 [Alnus glutinosa]
MLVKSTRAAGHIADLGETFETLRSHKMKLNPAKCAFGISSGKFLGFMVSQRGIEANPEKVSAVLDMQSPRTTKQLQQLTGRIAALNWFISRSTDKCLPFFKILRKAFEWSSECEEAFKKLKEYLTNPPLLSSPGGRRNLVSLPRSITLGSQFSFGPRRLRHSKTGLFHQQSTPWSRGEVSSDRKIGLRLNNLGTKTKTIFPGTCYTCVNRASAEEDITKTRSFRQGQALADFLLEFSNTPESKELPEKETWVAYVDGSSANQKSGVGVTLASPDGETFQYAIKLDFVTTNNEAEYEALLDGLSIAREMGARNLEIRSDSQVIVSHVQGFAEAQGEKMIQYLDKVRKCQSNFDRTVVIKVPREENARADALSKMDSGTGPVVKTSTRGVVIQTEPSILPKLDMMEIEERSDEPEWATDVIQYLRNGSLPEEKLRARKVKMHSARYVLIGGSLYRRGYTEPLLKCLTNSEAEYVLKEIHEGVCGNHSGSRMLAHKAMRAGYYWPTINKDSVKLV